MSVAKRAYVGAMNRLRKRMKRPISIVCDIMSPGFTDDDFVNKFKECFAGLWQEIIDNKDEHDEMDRGRIRKHFKPIYHFPLPSKFLLEVARCGIARTRKRHVLGEVKAADEREAIFGKYRKSRWSAFPNVKNTQKRCATLCKQLNRSSQTIL